MRFLQSAPIALEALEVLRQIGRLSSHAGIHVVLSQPVLITLFEEMFCLVHM
jgi:hypothetical protein